MVYLHLYSHSDIGSFDSYEVAQKMGNKEYRHKYHIEDYRANCRYEFEIINRRYSRLSLKMIRLDRVAQVLDHVEDEDVMQYHNYMQFENKPLPTIN